MNPYFFIIAVSAVSLLFTFFLIRRIQKSSSGEGKQVGISQAVKEGAKSYLNRQFKTIGIVGAVLFIILWVIPDLGFKYAIGFLVGALASGVSGYIGMMISTTTNVKVTEAAKTGLKGALNLSFMGGSVTGFLVVGLGLISVAGFYFITKDRFF